MHKFISAITAALLMSSFAAKAQNVISVRSTSLTNGEKENIDQAKYRITYEGKWVNNPSIKPYIYTDSEMRLDIGSQVSWFYDRTKQVRDSIMQASAKAGNFNFSNLPKGGRFPFVYYKNYPAVGKTIQLEALGTESYQCTENAETPDWQLIQDSIANIIGYHCLLAKTNFKGRTWYAWYAEDIPLQEGPWKLCGLPGLILKAYDENKEFEFSAIGISTLSTPSPITITKGKREEITQKDLRNAKEKFTPGMVLEGLNIKKAKIQDEKGNPIDMKKIMNKKNVFNPIELQ